jgi:hypothetical protein
MRAWLAALMLAAAPTWAAPFAVPVGDARIGLEAPAGFADTGFTGSPRLREIAESLTSASNRILLFAISDGDLRLFMQGDRPELRRFMIAVTPRALEDQSVATSQFDAFVGDVLRELGGPAPAQGDVLKYLDAQPRGKARHDGGIGAAGHASAGPPRLRREAGVHAVDHHPAQPARQGAQHIRLHHLRIGRRPGLDQARDRALDRGLAAPERALGGPRREVDHVRS